MKRGLLIKLIKVKLKNPLQFIFVHKTKKYKAKEKNRAENRIVCGGIVLFVQLDIKRKCNQTRRCKTISSSQFSFIRAVQMKKIVLNSQTQP